MPIALVSRACDLVACDEAQAERFLEDGYVIAPGAVVETWVADLSERVGDPNVDWRIIDGGGETTDSCTAASWCPLSAAALNHMLWPDGVSDGSDMDHEDDLLAFLREHPRGLR